MQAMTPCAPRQVELTEVPEPCPAAHEAVVEVEAYSVNRGETFLLDAPAPGWRPGKDIAGTVKIAAADGSGPLAGSRIVGHVSDSGWAQRAAVPTSTLAVLPDSVPTTVAAALPLAGLTAVRLLRTAGSVLGRRLLITGASGGVGHYLVELAMASGAEVTAVTATAGRGERLREFGATTVRSVAEASGWFDVTLDSIGGKSLVAARRKTHPRGTVVWFGQAGLEPAVLDFFDWVQGTAGAPIEAFHYARGDDETGVDLATLVRLVAEGRLHPEIGTLRLWQHTPDVIDDIRGRRLRGNAVLEVQQ